MSVVLESVTLAATGLAAYHHGIYPALLRSLVRRGNETAKVSGRDFLATTADSNLPSVTVLVPAYNEEKAIAQKIANILSLDYPADRLELRVICDGCTDETYAEASRAVDFDEQALGRVTVINCLENRGKTAVLNEQIERCDTDLVALTDTSSILAIDALLHAARHFADWRVGVVSGTYRLMEPGSAGEAAYWRFQTAMKAAEARIGGLIGAHGAFYVIRRSSFRPIPADTINDDFVIPMCIARDGLRTVYDPEVLTYELDGTSLAVDRQRRKRIGAGNMQQAIRLIGLLHPRHGGLAFAFFSSKFLRAFMPLILVLAWLGSLALAPTSPVFAVLAAGQSAGYLLAALVHFAPGLPWGRIGRAVHYLVQAHVANGIGALDYLRNPKRGPWRRIAT